MKTSQVGISLIKEFEGFSNKAYLDPVGIPTIGYGTTRINGKSVNIDQTCTPEEAEIWLLQEISFFEIVINRNVKVHLTQNQFDALVSIVYNVGPGKKGIKDGIIQLKNGSPSSLLRLLNTGDYVGASNEFDKWIYAGGKLLNGLKRRRAAEKKLFLSN